MDFHVPPISLSGMKTAVLTAKGPYGEGGGTGGTWSWDMGTPPWVRGSIYKKKIFRTQVQIHTEWPQYAKKF